MKLLWLRTIHRCPTLGAFALWPTAVVAQAVTGVWQGKLPIPDNPRVVLKIEAVQSGILRGFYYPVDRSATSIPLTTVSYVAPNIDVSFVFANISFHGIVALDGKSITGTWQQEGHSYPLALQLASSGTAWKYESSSPLQPMNRSSDPSFEVASIRPAPPEGKGPLLRFRTREF